MNLGGGRERAESVPLCKGTLNHSELPLRLLSQTGFFNIVAVFTVYIYAALAYITAVYDAAAERKASTKTSQELGLLNSDRSHTNRNANENMNESNEQITGKYCCQNTTHE